MVALRPHDEIDRRCAADDLLSFGLSDAACNRNRQPTSRARCSGLERSDAAQFGIHFLCCFLANMAGVEDDEVGFASVQSLGKALGCKRVRHTMGVVDVHLAAEGFDVELARSGHAVGWSCASSQVNAMMILVNLSRGAIGRCGGFYPPWGEKKMGVDCFVR